MTHTPPGTGVLSRVCLRVHTTLSGTAPTLCDATYRSPEYTQARCTCQARAGYLEEKQNQHPESHDIEPLQSSCWLAFNSYLSRLTLRAMPSGCCAFGQCAVLVGTSCLGHSEGHRSRFRSLKSRSVLELPDTTTDPAAFRSCLCLVANDLLSETAANRTVSSCINDCDQYYMARPNCFTA